MTSLFTLNPGQHEVRRSPGWFCRADNTAPSVPCRTDRATPCPDVAALRLPAPRPQPSSQRSAGQSGAAVDGVIPRQEFCEPRARHPKGLCCSFVCVAHVGLPCAEFFRRHQ